MVCNCPQCGMLMGQTERGLYSTCICPGCGHRCDICLGSGEQMKKGGEPPSSILETYEWDKEKPSR